MLKTMCHLNYIQYWTWIKFISLPNGYTMNRKHSYRHWPLSVNCDYGLNSCKCVKVKSCEHTHAEQVVMREEKKKRRKSPKSNANEIIYLLYLFVFGSKNLRSVRSTVRSRKTVWKSLYMATLTRYTHYTFTDVNTMYSRDRLVMTMRFSSTQRPSNTFFYVPHRIHSVGT